MNTKIEERLTVRPAKDRSAAKDRSTDDAETNPQRPRWPLLAVAAVLVIAAAAMYVVNHRHDSLADSADDARTTGVAHVEELLSYDYRDIEHELEIERDWLTKGFMESYTPLISDTFGPEAEKAKLITEANAVASGVESSSRDHVELLVFVNVAVQQGGSKTPQITGSRLHVDLDEVDGDWLISAIDPI
ncbi:hypothetical protein ACIRON_16685 [Nocardioides sp. NPDC101246]|uniref:hypothetical protein n=1 Tax=Nocardioides sp. NPDC101246 TaxID=3364336 RepID=UPI0037F2A8AD